MKRYFFILLVLIALSARCELRYFSADSIAVPRGDIVAVEVRAANGAAHPAGASLSGWRVEWSGAEITLEFDFRDYVEGVSVPTAILQCNGKTAKIDKGLNVSGGCNSVAAEWRADGRVHILCGERKLRDYLILDSLPKPVGAITASAIGGNLDVQDIIVEINEDTFSRLITDYSREQIEEAPKWVYLDRQNDPSTAIVGGNYVLAQIGNELVYVGGGVTNAAHWHTGMLKGRLTPTGFSGYYRLEWYDATGKKMPGENFAEHDADLGLLKLSFPGVGAHIRLKAAE